MTIRHRITLLVVLMFVALMSIGGYAVYQTRRSATEVRSVTQGVVPSALASADLVSQLKDVQLATMTLVYAPDANMVSQAQDELKAKQKTLSDALDVQGSAAASHAQVGLVAQARESLANYFSAIADTAKMKAEGKNEMAQAFLFANVAQYRDELEGIVTTLRVEKNRQKDDAIKSLNDMLSTTTSAIAGVTGGAVLLLTVIGLLLYRQITQPLTRMQSMMSEIASNQDFTRRVPVGRMDEIGHSIVAFNGMIEKIQQSSAQLKRKTADIQAMLQNMQQGILTIVDGAQIHAEYSAYLEAIFETNEIAGQPVMDLVFSHTDLDANALSQVDAAIYACLGEDSINFAFNQHLLVNEITRTMPDGRKKILDLSWSAITDETDTVVRLMLCVRDVTELRELAAEAGEQKRQLEMIGEILSVSEEKFHHFVESSTSFIQQNERIISQDACPDSAAIAELFRNMHTIKGNARTYRFQHLTGVAHEAEQRYDALRRGEPLDDGGWDPQALIDDLARVKEALTHYATINEVSLGRKSASQAGLDTSRFVPVEREAIDASLRQIEHADVSDLKSMQAMREAVRHTLRLFGTERVDDMLSGVLDSLPSLAKELGKAEPVVRIDDHGYRLRSEAGPTLTNVFVHLLRNSIDHGIEKPDERAVVAKPSAGTILLDVNVASGDGTLQITLGDDGRGLALARIRGIAVERGWIDADAEIADEEVAEFIFRSGFSTASAVTDVSGRGVGMDAVRDFLAREGGRIALHFVDGKRGAAYRRFETIVTLPGRWAVGTAGLAPAPVRAAGASQAETLA
ncbi:HAMP domain-containing protein [Paraburkholderia caballeronis]|uniref:HAMP domain-containing protein n=1 Tax=Paraburkholderia caballeronis TaxID=416943 RepID=UPI0010666711|nr:MCP four helix bundle domain-containing protein [Paraburkholderia caballeronis]TDV03995.1 two-component system chemotaxis sensor kinase CheA [Paraburkholderia caballeronis]TDV07088.1 two-component system chemotaxis sensor kinase CheA [Paraburkholderia caballeronis]TDV17785.1 two-component system chemotaxis sensor kinase CheA [Paraburkholderia caballeronis]TDV24771.1 two-component system chemotaxis sensor kinase CheA [Paraburkholderia caballeronis]